MNSLLKTKMTFEKDKKEILTEAFSEAEKNLIESAFKRIPKSLLSNQLKGLVKMRKPFDLSDDSSGMTYLEGYIILYEDTFNRPQSLERKFLHELIHHYHEGSGKSALQKYKTKWWPRSGPFLTDYAKFSVEEDFTVNAEYYLTEPDTIKSKASKIFDWYLAHLDQRFKLKECSR